MQRARSTQLSKNAMPVFLSFFFSSRTQIFLVDGLQPPPKMKYSVMLAREQSVDADSRFGGKFLKADSFDFVCDEHFTLLFREFVERRVKLFKQDASRIGSLRSRIRRWDQFFKRKRIGVFGARIS